MSFQNYLSRLNTKQREAVLYGDGPLLILAGAGSGKTSTMAYRIGHLITERKNPAYSILGLSFTRKAAQELKERVTKIIKNVAGKGAAQGLTITTFHSLCVRILRESCEHLGFQKNFTILDQNDQLDILKTILKQIKIDDRKFDTDSILFEIGQAKNRFLDPDQARDFFLDSGRLPPDYAIATASAFEHYQEKLKALNAMDFDDLLFHGVRLLENHPEVRAHYNQRFRYILVDEYQDTNPAQFKLLRLLTQQRQNICVVGDDDQSIYAWRGADPTHILEFGRYYPGAHMITLDQNYRSTSTILDAANKVIAQNKVRHPKTLWSDKGLGEPIVQIIVEEDRAEAEAVAEEILRRAQGSELLSPGTDIEVYRGETETKTPLRPWKDFAVLYRSNPQSRLFEEALRMRKVPYKIVGTLSFLERKEVKDTLSYWRVIANPKDDASCRRIINWPTRSIGRAAIETVSDRAFLHNTSFYESLADTRDLTQKSAAGIHGFRALIDGLRSELEQTALLPHALADWAKRSLEVIGIKKTLYEDHEDDPAQAQRKWENVEELANALGQLDLSELLEKNENAVSALVDFLSRMTLDPSEKDKDDEENKNQVTLLTLHGAKGLEYPIVFLVGMEEGFLPHRRTIEEAKDFSEERRLAYVGITRAKEQLILTRAKNRIRYGKPVPRNPSRFLEEIPQSLIVTQDESLTPEPTTQEKRVEHENKVKNFLAEIRAQIQR